MYKKLLFILFFLISSISFSQTKFEKEIRIKTALVPNKALGFINSLCFNKKIKWYKEFSIDHTSIEAKTKYKGRRYSIEFTKEGILEDVEIKIKENQIPTKVRLKLNEYFINTYSKYTIEKIQIQYIGSLEALSSFLCNETTNNDLTINYEIVIHTKIEKKFKKIEFLFSENGSFLNAAEIISKNSDNIEY